MSFHKWQIAWELTFDKSADKLVYLAYVSHANHKTHFTAFLAAKTIAEETGLNVKTVETARDRLVKNGRLTDTGERRGRTRQTVVFQLIDLLNAYSKTPPKTEGLSATYLQTPPKMGELKTPVFSKNTPKNGERIRYEQETTTTQQAREVSFDPLGVWGTLRDRLAFAGSIDPWAELEKFKAFNEFKEPKTEPEWQELFKRWLVNATEYSQGRVSH